MGTLAIEIGNLTKLKGLLLFKNQISGEIPESFGNLKALDLSDNQISGPIPSELANLKELTQLRLMNNYLIGEVPANIGDLPNGAYVQTMEQLAKQHP